MAEQSSAGGAETSGATLARAATAMMTTTSGDALAVTYTPLTTPTGVSQFEATAGAVVSGAQDLCQD
jgi:hypothetical protein